MSSPEPAHVYTTQQAEHFSDIQSGAYMDGTRTTRTASAFIAAPSAILHLYDSTCLFLVFTLSWLNANNQGLKLTGTMETCEDCVVAKGTKADVSPKGDGGRAKEPCGMVVIDFCVFTGRKVPFRMLSFFQRGLMWIRRTHKLGDEATEVFYLNSSDYHPELCPKVINGSTGREVYSSNVVWTSSRGPGGGDVQTDSSTPPAPALPAFVDFGPPPLPQSAASSTPLPSTATEPPSTPIPSEPSTALPLPPPALGDRRIPGRTRSATRGGTAMPLSPVPEEAISTALPPPARDDHSLGLLSLANSQVWDTIREVQQAMLDAHPGVRGQGGAEKQQGAVEESKESSPVEGYRDLGDDCEYSTLFLDAQQLEVFGLLEAKTFKPVDL
eukprot:g5678.t2